jgi:hypothetical protein
MLFVLGALILAPILEELSFRGYFSKSKTAKIVMLIFFPLFIFVMKTNVLLFFVIPYYILILIDFFTSKKLNRTFLYLGGALLFSLVHYQESDFKSFQTILPMLTQLGLGLILTWIVVNFSLRYAILVHFLHNFLIILPLFLYLQFPDEKINTLKIDDFQITWSKVPLINGEFTKIVRPNSHSISGTHINPLKIYKSFHLLDSDTFILVDKEPFYKYDIQIYRSEDSSKELDKVILRKILVESDLIKEVNVE